MNDRELAWNAARGRCVACSGWLGTNGVVHHRQAKGMGGRKGARAAGTYTDRPPFTVVIHDACHKYVHEHPNDAKELGLIVSSWADPGEVPVNGLPGLRTN